VTVAGKAKKQASPMKGKMPMHDMGGGRMMSGPMMKPPAPKKRAKGK